MLVAGIILLSMILSNFFGCGYAALAQLPRSKNYLTPLQRLARVQSLRFRALRFFVGVSLYRQRGWVDTK